MILYGNLFINCLVMFNGMFMRYVFVLVIVRFKIKCLWIFFFFMFKIVFSIERFVIVLKRVINVSKYIVVNCRWFFLLIFSDWFVDVLLEKEVLFDVKIEEKLLWFLKG